MEKAINLETTIKNLPSHDLNLYHKDEEENNDEAMLFEGTDIEEFSKYKASVDVQTQYIIDVETQTEETSL